jgi:O-antigen/teichoic acid export membrane protein
MDFLKQECLKVKRSSMARNAGWVMAGTGTGIIMQGFTFVLLARLLGPREYGIYVAAFALAMIASQYSALGSGTVLLRYVSIDRSKFAPYWGSVLLTLLTVGTLLIGGITLLGRKALKPESANLIVFAGIANCFFQQLAVEAGRVFQAFQKLKLTALVNAVTHAARLIAVGVLFVIERHSTARQWSIMSVIVSGITALLAFGLVSFQIGMPRVSISNWIGNISEGLGFAFAGSTTAVYNDLDKTMLGHYGMDRANGIYTMAYRIVDLATTPIWSIQAAAIPKFFQRGKESLSSAAELSNKLLARVVTVGAAVALGMFLAAPVLPKVLGHGFQNSVEALRWLCWIPVFRGIHLINGCALTGSGLQNYRTAAQVVASVFNFLLNLYLIPIHGWHGAAWSSLLTDGGLALLNAVILHLLLKVRDREEALVLD